ncbi:MAG TPA: PQQ-binding-like beta-propeller repeat protein [Gemmataceae bacterium]|nr:PQQ-binding-like beta-propeller repeat protein [Gemmataceae bacterium]
MHWLRSLLLTVFVCSVTVLPAFAEDWPQWLGPRRDNSSKEKVAPWKEKLKVLWRKPAGEGHSSPVVADGRVFIHAKVADKNEEEIVAFDAKSGEELWRKRYERAAFRSLYGNGPRATPAVVKDRLYAFGITGVLTCLDIKKGDKIWQVDTLKKFEAKNLFFGMACSPLVAGERVLVNVGGKGHSIVAFDRTSGEVAWKSMDDPASYSSPIVFDQGGKRQVVFLTGANVVSLNPRGGSVYWAFPLVDRLLESSTTPIRAGDLLLASSITYGSVGLKLLERPSKPMPGRAEAWKNKELTSYFSTPVAIGKEHIYMVTGKTPGPFTKPSADLHCIEAKSGKKLWTKAKVGTYHASLMRSGDDKLLLLTDGGELALLEPDPKGYRELARSKVSGPKTWAHPALSNGRLYVRDKTSLLCLQMAP